MHDPELFAPWFKDRASWRAWEVFLSALFGLRLDGDDAAAMFLRHTGGRAVPTQPAREAWVIVGRRGGKSRIAAMVALYLACFRDYGHLLAPGEVGTLPVIAADRSQARTVMRYITGFLNEVPMLNRLVVNRTKETIELSTRVTIEVHSASFRAVRGYTLVAAVCDEIAFWSTDEAAANPDTEILTGLRPGMATIPGAMLIVISSPYARRGTLWDAYRKHYGEAGPVLVWQADTRTMNPAVDPQVIAAAYATDDIAAAAEYGAEFRRDIESFVSREAVDAVVVPGRRELPPVAGTTYRAFVDPSGGSQDSMTLAITHLENGRAVLDALRERRPPFSPSDVVAEFADTLQTYGISSVTGDRYGGEWPRERFRERGIMYIPAEAAKSDLYRDLLPLVNSGQVELLDQPRLIAQLCALERRTSRAGKDSIDHGPGGHDDVVNAAAGALTNGLRACVLRVVPGYDDDRRPQLSPLIEQLHAALPFAFQPKPTGTCGECVSMTVRPDGHLCRARRMLVQRGDIACEWFQQRLE